MVAEKHRSKEIEVMFHLANDEDIVEPGSKDVALGVLDVHNVERSRVLLPKEHQCQTSGVKIISNNYLEIMVPTRPALAPPVTMQRFPTSKVMMSWTLLVARSSWMLSFT